MGKEIPLYASNGAAVLQPNGYLEFIGAKNRAEMDRHLFEHPDTDLLNPLHSLVSDTAVYFLTIAPVGKPTLRYLDQPNDWTNLPARTTSCRKTITTVFSEQFNHTRYDFENLVAYSSYDMGEGFGSTYAQARKLNLTWATLLQEVLRPISSFAWDLTRTAFTACVCAHSKPMRPTMPMDNGYSTIPWGAMK
ncbi:MAG: hypothetical protein IPO07_13705 [Haliscomenobacter sp.]|nr:hypothetical protein [Haliscomenobacter sp.]MBK9489713.1 hypothetical protein [Haliscomenobacter sp.]